MTDSDKPVFMYIKASCPFCSMAQALLEKKGVAFDKVDINVEPERRDEMIERSGRRTVPQVFVHGEAVGGYDELAALEESGRLDELLAA